MGEGGGPGSCFLLCRLVSSRNKPDLGWLLLLLVFVAAMGAEVVATGEGGLGGSETFSMVSPWCEAREGCCSLICRWILCSSSAPKDTVGVDKERRRSKKLQAASWVGAHPRWCSRRGNGARDGGQLPAFIATPSTLLAERRPFLFLLAWMLKGRQVRFCSESIASSSGEHACRRRSGGDHGDPSGFVPGVVVLQVLQLCVNHSANKLHRRQKILTAPMAKPGILGRSSMPRSNEGMRLVFSAVIGIMLGYLFGISFPTVNITKLHFPSSIVSYIEDRNSGITTQTLLNHAWTSANSHKKNNSDSKSDEIPKIYVTSNPKGAERLPPGIVVSETDLYPRRLWGEPSEDLTIQPKYLVTFTVGIAQKANIDAAVKKFSENFTIMLFHYDGRTTEWDEFEWSKRAIHVSVSKQTKWWYAKRFLHPDVVARYDYIFIWDEDLGVQHFNAEEYIKLVRKHGLEISQPGLEPDRGLTWQMTKRRGDREVHKVTEERPGWCSDPHLPPCAAFVEIMATVFSRDAWRCVWHMIQNDLIHGWGLDFALRKCVEPAHEKIGVVDAQWIVHQGVPSLGNQGKSENGRAPWEGVRGRCRKEWGIFQARLADAEKKYYLDQGITPPNSTSV